MITQENYFSNENNDKYMSSSQFKIFLECEFRAMAELKGEYKRESSISMLVGSYVDSHFDKTLDIFRAKNPDIFTRSGELKSNFKQANYIIERLERDEMFMKYMSGQSQVIKIGEIEGVEFKGKFDSYHEGKAIVDLKVMKDFRGIWKDGLKLNFIEFYGYDIQAAIYQEIEGNKLPFFIAAVTKENEPDLAILQIPQQRLDYCLDIVKNNITRIKEVKSEKAEPIRCELCDYCKLTKKITEVISYEQLDNLY